MEEFDKVSAMALKDHPLYYRIVECKIDGLQNAEIRDILEEALPRFEFPRSNILDYTI